MDVHRHVPDLIHASRSELTAVGDGVRIRTAPHLNATVVGEAFTGQQFTDPGCTSVQGDNNLHRVRWPRELLGQDHLPRGDALSAAACYTNA
jgi:hypothetical protein